MTLDRSRTEIKSTRDPCVPEPLRDERQDVEFPLAQLAERRVLSGARLHGEEAAHFAQQDLPRRLVLEEDVVAPLERDEASPRDEARQMPSFLERNHGVVACMKDDRRGCDRSGEMRHVELSAGPPQFRCHLARGRRALELVVPLHLLFRRARDEQTREDAPEHRIRSSPCHACQRKQYIRLLALLRCQRTSIPSPRVGPVQHELAHSFRMARSVSDRDRSSVRDPEKSEPFQAGRVANSLEIADPRVQRELPDVTIRQPAAALVVANDGIGPSELVQPMAPNRAVPIELEVRKPRRRPDDG